MKICDAFRNPKTGALFLATEDHGCPLPTGLELDRHLLRSTCHDQCGFAVSIATVARRAAPAIEHSERQAECPTL